MKKVSRDFIDILKVETTPAVVVNERLFGDIRLLIESAKSQLSQTASNVLSTLYPIFVRFKAKSLSANQYIIESLFLVPLPILILYMIDII